MDPVKMLEQAFDNTGRIVKGLSADQLSAPTPCTEWDVRALLNHTIGVIKMFESAVKTGTPDPSVMATDNVGSDPAASFDEAAKSTLKAWSTPGALDKKYQLPFGERPAAVAVGINTFDTFVHGWDLARATGQEAQFDQAVCESGLEFLRGIVTDQTRQAGAFGPEIPVPADAPAVDRLMGFLGRQP